jgi:hypothetical protein
MSSKVFRDPLYNYIGIDRKRDGWLIDLLNCKELQRLRRIHQLGVSYFTYPGADHNRLIHSLGVLHLTLQALQHLKQTFDDAQVNQAREPLLATALVHDVGHGPFSHLFEPCLEIDHEVWSKAIILSEDTSVHRVLAGVAKRLPQTVADLIDKDNNDHPTWMKYLLSSQLDMDRLDYLRRDSLFTGAGYGHFDWHRILSTFELYEQDGGRDIVWSEKAKFAIEEFIFARYYMYQNVYLHKTTRGFEKMVEAMWRRARKLHREGKPLSLIPAIRRFWSVDDPDVRDYLNIEEFTVLQQIQVWTENRDAPLADLARRFLVRERFVAVDPPPEKSQLAPDFRKWEGALKRLVERHGHKPGSAYCLRDELKGKYNQPYFPETQADEQSAKNAIRLKIEGQSKPVEISTILERLKPITTEPVGRFRYYVPKDVEQQVRKLVRDWKGDT